MAGWLPHLTFAAFLAGLAGGVHCAAMCGPIVAVCGGLRSAGSGMWRRAVAYNGGRILSYVVAGAIAGALGSPVSALRGAASAQSVMAALAGGAMMLLAAHLAGWTPVTRRLEAAGGAIWRRIQPYSNRVLPANTFARALGLGALWGWLPCGMVYAALATAIATAHPGAGALVMLAFGLGTLPNLLAIAFAASRLKQLLQHAAIRRCAALGIAALGVLGLAIAFHAQH